MTKRKRRRRRKKRPSEPPAAESVAIDSANAPVEGSDAGPNNERLAPGDRNLKSYRSSAHQHFAAAKQLLMADRAHAEREARAAIDRAVRAFWWAEGEPLEESLHALMHRIGRWTRQQFGCELDWSDGRYRSTCPIVIAHKRFGFSPGFVARHECSICDEDLSECEHDRDRLYWVRGGAETSARCRVCMEEACDHSADELHRAPVRSVVKDIKFREVSIVRRPEEPEARMTEIPVPIEDLEQALGPSFQAGMPVSCDKCLGECWGFDELPTEAR